MSSRNESGPSRREMIKQSGKIAVASALAGVVLPQVHAGESNTIQIALVGCGGRGTGAAADAMSARAAPVKLVAMADVFPRHLDDSYANLKKEFDKQVDVPKERQFIGFDAYRKAMDCLKPGDIAIFATPPAFRWVHFTHAIQKGLNVFMEKPVAVDGPAARKMFKLADEAKKRNLKVGVGLMCRHCPARQELFHRIKDGQIGEVTLLQAYRQKGIEAKEFAPKQDPRQDPITELLYQIKWFHSFLWASGGCFSDFLIHNIDECCWMKDAFPVEAKASGGRHYRGGAIDQNFDHYSVEYTFADGTKLMLQGRNIVGCHQEFASYAHGTRGSAIISTSSHWPARSRIYKGHNFNQKELAWQIRPETQNPYQVEWEDLLHAVRDNKPYNEVPRGTEASLVTAMGRMAAHTGQVIKRDQILNSEHEFAPGVDRLTMDSPAPVRADHDGKYPVPQPGRNGYREF
jgi:predicted dehydrogenase